MHIFHCTECGKNTDGLMHCVNMEGEEWLCPDCIKDSGYCLGCGTFSAGISSFDFSNMPGYCETCQDEIINAMGEDQEDEGDDPYSWLLL